MGPFCYTLSFGGFVGEFILIFAYHVERGAERAVLNNQCITGLDGCKFNAIGTFGRPLDIVAVGDLCDSVLGDELFSDFDHDTILSFGMDKQQIAGPLYEKACEQVSLTFSFDCTQNFSVGVRAFDRMETEVSLVLRLNYFACFPSVSVGTFNKVLASHKKHAIDDSHHHLELRLIVDGTLDVLLGNNVEIHEHLEKRNLLKLAEHNVVHGELGHCFLAFAKELEYPCCECLCFSKCNFCHDVISVPLCQFGTTSLKKLFFRLFV